MGESFSRCARKCTDPPPSRCDSRTTKREGREGLPSRARNAVTGGAGRGGDCSGAVHDGGRARGAGAAGSKAENAERERERSCAARRDFETCNRARYRYIDFRNSFASSCSARRRLSLRRSRATAASSLRAPEARDQLSSVYFSERFARRPGSPSTRSSVQVFARSPTAISAPLIAFPRLERPAAQKDTHNPSPAQPRPARLITSLPLLHTHSSRSRHFSALSVQSRIESTRTTRASALLEGSERQHSCSGIGRGGG